MATRNIFVKMTLQGALDSQLNKINGSLTRIKKTSGGLNSGLGKTNKMLMAMGGFAASSVAGFYAMSAGINEVIAGLKFVEDFKLSAATLTGFIATFSKAGERGDFSRAFSEANDYAKALIPKLEIMDAKTIATGRDLMLMVETMAQYGVVLDINNQRQEESFLNIVNALKMITKGQNQEIQMRQEIHALMMGQMRMTDRLPKLLKRIDPDLENHIDLWKRQGTLIENVGELLEDFGQTIPLIEQTWAAVGTTMQTIHVRILRGGMLPVYEDLLKMSKAINGSLMNTQGNLTPLANMLQKTIKVAWVDIKNTIKLIGSFLRPWKPLFKFIGYITLRIVDGFGMMLAIMVPLADRFNKLVEGMVEGAQSIVWAFEGVWRGLSFDMTGAKQAFLEAQKHFFAAGEATGESFGSGLTGEMAKAFAEYQAAKKIAGLTGAEAPEMALPGPNKEQIKAYEALMTSWKRKHQSLMDAVFSARARAGDASIADEQAQIRRRWDKLIEAEREAALKRNAAYIENNRSRYIESDAIYQEWLENAKANESKELKMVKDNEEAKKQIIDRYAILRFEEEQKVVDKALENDERYIELNKKMWNMIDEARGVMARQMRDVTMFGKMMKTVGKSMEDGFIGAFDSIGKGMDALKETAINMIKSIVDEMFKLSVAQPFAKWATAGLSELISGIGGAGVSESLVSWHPEQGFATGGSFKVGGSGGTDSQRVSFRASPDETVTIETPEQRKAGNGSKTIKIESTYEINIIAADAKSIHDMTKRNPDSVVSPFVEQVEKGNMKLIGAIRSIM